MIYDALDREESCGGHFREEHQTSEGEALRDDENYTFVSAWEYKGEHKEPELHKENLSYEEVRDFYEHFRADCSNKNKKNTHVGCDKLEHDSGKRVKPKTVIYFVPFEKKIRTTKVHKKCKIICAHNN